MPGFSIRELQEKIKKLDAMLASMKNAKPAIRKPLEDARHALLSQLQAQQPPKPQAIPKPKIKLKQPKQSAKTKQKQNQQKAKKPRKPNKQKKKYYQATGDLACTVEREGDRVIAKTDNATYPLFPQIGYDKNWQALLERKLPEKLLVHVHPVSSGCKCTALCLWGFKDIPPEMGTKNLFKMRGIYNPARIGKLTVPRNAKAKKQLAKMNESQIDIAPKTHSIKWESPSVMWEPGNGKPTVHFVDLICRLDNGDFQVVKEISSPTTALPKVLRRNAIGQIAIASPD